MGSSKGSEFTTVYKGWNFEEGKYVANFWFDNSAIIFTNKHNCIVTLILYSVLS